MKVVTNHKLIKRNSRIGQITTIGALVVLGIGLFLTFKMPDKFAYSLACLLAGFFLSQVGIYFGNRWGRSPRPDEIINKAMRGMGREYTIYHYTTPAAHLVLGPAGIWVIRPYYQGGTITYDGKRWRSKGGGASRAYMRLFGQETMGRPDMETDTEIKALGQQISKELPLVKDAKNIRAVLLFTDPKVEIKNGEKSPIPMLKPDQLKELLKSSAKEKPISAATLEAVRALYPKNEEEI